MVSFDVKSLFTNVPRKDALQTIIDIVSADPNFTTANHITAVSAGTKSFTCISKMLMLRNTHVSYLDKGKVSSESSRHMCNLCYCSSTPQTYAHYIPETLANVRKA